MHEVLIQSACLERCNSMRHLDTVEEKIQFIEQCALDGLVMQCRRGPRPGQKLPICSLPEQTKQGTEAIVRPIMQARQAAAELSAIAPEATVGL